MILDLATIQASVKDQLTDPNEKADAKRIDRAIANCLDDLSTRLVSVGILTNYSVTIPINTRVYTITGEAADLRYLYALKYGTGDSQVVLDYVDTDEFLRKYDSPGTAAGTPSRFTILDNDGGDPVIKFNRPTLASDTLAIFYALDYSSNNLNQLRSGSAVIAGTLAWFWGISDGKPDPNTGMFIPGRGQRSYGVYLELVKLMRASDHFLIKTKPKVGMNSFDRSINEIRSNMRSNRS